MRFISTITLLLLLALLNSAQAERFILQNPAQTRATIHSIAFTDETHGIAVGDGGTILATTDAGKNWVEQKSGTTYTLYSVSFPMPHTAVIVGDHGVILQSSNGGTVWHRRFAGSINEFFLLRWRTVFMA